jgi:hypothetical protein
MKAVQFDRYGGTDVLRVADAPLRSRVKGKCWSRSRPPQSTG